MPSASGDHGEGAAMGKARAAVSLAFLAFGTQLGLWFAHIPEIARRLALEPAVLGLSLLAIGVIGVVTQWPAGVAIARVGSRPVTIVLLPAFVVAQTLLIAAPTLPLFFIFAALTGLVSMPANIGNNTLAAEFERRHGRPAMSSFHGFFSVGGLLGSLLGGALITAGYGDGRGAAMVGGIMLIASLWGTVHALDMPPEPHTPQGLRFAVPPPALLGICLLILCSTLIEGSVGNWSALYLDTIQHAGPTLAASGYTLFSIAMAILRFAGGPVVERLGRRGLIIAGAALMATGLWLVVLSPWPLLSALGFLVVAVGAANFAPVLTSAAAATPGVAPSLGIAALTTAMTVGLFGGPPVIGFIAQAWGLHVAFGCLAAVAVAAAVGAAMCGWDPKT